MRKIKLLTVIVITAILLCSCANVNVTCSIGYDNTAEMEIYIVVDLEDMTLDEENAVYSNADELILYWENSLGYDVETYFSDKTYEIILSKTEKCDSKEEALEELTEMMGAGYSPFKKVEGGYSSSYLNEYINLRAEVDLTEIIDYDYVLKLSSSDLAYITNCLYDCSGNIVFDLGGKTIEYEGSLSHNTNVVPLVFDEPVEIYSLVEIPNEVNKKAFDTLQNKATQHENIKNTYLKYMLLAAGVLFVLVIAMVATILVKKSKSNKSATPGEPESEIKSTEDSKPEQTQTETKETEKQ